MNSLLSDNYCVIMAGGIGSRFWPWSRESCPKQFLDIVGSGRSMIQETFDRFDTLVPEENVMVITGKCYEKMILNELPALHPSQVLTEPERRNTAPVIAYAAYKIASINPDAVMIVSPADHHILLRDEGVEATYLHRAYPLFARGDGAFALDLDELQRGA